MGAPDANPGQGEDWLNVSRQGLWLVAHSSMTLITASGPTYGSGHAAISRNTRDWLHMCFSMAVSPSFHTSSKYLMINCTQSKISHNVVIVSDSNCFHIRVTLNHNVCCVIGPDLVVPSRVSVYVSWVSMRVPVSTYSWACDSSGLGF